MPTSVSPTVVGQSERGHRTRGMHLSWLADWWSFRKSCRHPSHVGRQVYPFQCQGVSLSSPWTGWSCLCLARSCRGCCSSKTTKGQHRFWNTIGRSKQRICDVTDVCRLANRPCLDDREPARSSTCSLHPRRHDRKPQEDWASPDDSDKNCEWISWLR